MQHGRIVRIALAALVVVPLVALAAPADAAPTPKHCVVHVTGQKATGELVTSAPQCYSTETQAASVAALSSFTLGVHYDGFGWTGSSFSVVGSDCLGGWLNLSASWVNKVSSTLNGCGQIKHYDGFNLTGGVEATFGAGGNLSTNNNKTNSIQYLT